jgi:Peptidase A4 family
VSIWKESITGKLPGQARFLYRNLTQGAYTHFILTSTIDPLFAETVDWIVERISQGEPYNTLARYGAVYFEETYCWYQAAGQSLDASSDEWEVVNVGAPLPPQNHEHVWRKITAENGAPISLGEPVAEKLLRCRYVYTRG